MIPNFSVVPTEATRVIAPNPSLSTDYATTYAPAPELHDAWLPALVTAQAIARVAAPEKNETQAFHASRHTQFASSGQPSIPAPFPPSDTFVEHLNAHRLDLYCTQCPLREFFSQLLLNNALSRQRMRPGVSLLLGLGNL